MTSRSTSATARAARQAARAVVLCVAASLCFAVVAPALAATLWTVRAAGPAQAQAQNPAAPASVTASCASPTTARTIALSWTAVSHASSYTISQSTTSATAGFSVVASGITTTSWTSASLAYGSTYWYKVTTVISSTWQSAASAATTGRTINRVAPFCQ